MKGFRKILACVLMALTLISTLTTAMAASKEMKVSASRVVVRMTPDEEGYKVGNVGKGVTVRTLKQSGAYSKVEIMSGALKGKTGYIFTAFLNKPGEEEDDKAVVGPCVVRKAVYLRSAPNKAKSEILRTLRRKEEVEVLSIDSHGWAKVETKKGETAYCYSTYLKALPRK